MHRKVRYAVALAIIVASSQIVTARKTVWAPERLLLHSSSPDLCPHLQPGSVAEDPPLLRSKNGVLEVEFSYRTSLDQNGNPKFCYITPDMQQSPTLQLDLGDTLKIHLTNDVPASVNISDYGTQVIHIAINPGDSYDYNIQISDAVTPGNYWYHPHLTGDTEAAIQGGATGSIIISGLENNQPAVQGLPERVFMLRDFDTPSSVENDTNAPAWDISINYVPVPFVEDYPPAVISMKPNEVQVWDITNSAADTIFDLQIQYDGVPQVFGIISRDGAPLRSRVNGKVQAAVINETSLVLGCAARAQLLVQGPGPEVQNATLMTQLVDTGPDGDYDPERPIANIVLDNSRPDPALVFPVNGTAVPQVFADASVQKVDRNRTVYFSEVLQDPSNPDSPTSFYITETGNQPVEFYVYEPPSIVVPRGAIEEWTIENRAMELHDFHIHQLHFTVLEANNIQTINVNGGTPYIVGQFVETVVIPYWNGTGSFPSYKVLMDFTRVDVGDFVVHCHMGEHEDQGMTTIVRVTQNSSS